jgi:DNA-binding CsgD family transcriptional regulator/PAS domain-containing protein
MLPLSGSLFPLIENLYRAADDPTQWDGALRAIATAMNATAASLFSRSPEGALSFAFTPGLPKEMVAEIPKFLGLNVRMNAMRAAGPMKICVDYDHTSEEEMVRHPYYAKFLSRYGHGYYAGAMLIAGAESETKICFLRTRDLGPFGAAELALFETVLPHLRQAILHALRIEKLNEILSVNQSALERISAGVIALQNDGKPIFTNAAADQILKAKDGLRIDENGIKALRGTDDVKLQALIASCLNANGNNAGTNNWSTMIGRLSNRAPYSVSVSAWQAPNQIHSQPRPKVLVIIRDPSATPAHSEQEIAKLIGLTPAEARLAKQLADGRTVEAAASDIGISLSTARTQLRSIFRKTNTNRQTDLVRRLTLTLGTSPQ